MIFCKHSFYTKKLLIACDLKIQKRKVTIMCECTEIPVELDKLLTLAKSTIIPKLSGAKHKGQCGRIGIIGGSLEYTGAPYFAAMSALKLGADLAHVFCQRDAAIVIKSYSPELIVHPVLDQENALEQMEPWLERLHVLVIGPGLGRDASVQTTVTSLMEMCHRLKKPMIIDADGLNILQKDLNLISGYQNVILTPNAIEFKRIFSDDDSVIRERISQLGDGVIVLEKGAKDRIHIPNTREIYTMPTGGSGRRCGGQGDILCGTMATFFNWSLVSSPLNSAYLAASCASFLVKECNAAGFKKYGRSMLASNMVNEIHNVFQNVFEHDE